MEIYPEPEILKRIDQLNKEQGKEGTMEKPPENIPTAADHWEKDKEAILSDYYAMKLREFLKKWRMSSTTWMKLKERWEVKGKPRGTAARPPKWQNIAPKMNEAKKAARSNNGEIEGLPLPMLPEFDSSWPELVQLRWLDTYAKLVGGKR